MSMCLDVGDTVALVSRVLFDDDVRREGTVVGVGDDGVITAAFSQLGAPPMRVTSLAKYFTLVRQRPTVVETKCPSCGAPIYRRAELTTPKDSEEKP